MILKQCRLGVAVMTILLAAAGRAEIWQQDASFAPVFEASEPHSGVILSAALPDGSVLVSSSYSYIDGHLLSGLAHLRADGSFDTAYQSPFPNNVNVLAVYPDGRVLVCHTTNDSYAPAMSVHRLLSSGALDSSFNPATVVPSSTPMARLQGDGRIVLAGTFTAVAGVNAAAVIRLNPDGSPDPTFTSPFAASSVTVRDVCPQPDGKMVLVGDFTAKGVSSTLVRLLASGAIESSFPAAPPTDEFYAVNVLTSGKIMAATFSGGTVRRYNADGSADTGYGAAFPRLTSYVGRPMASGRVYFLMADGTDTKLRRLKADGSLDPDFSYSTPTTSYYAVTLPETWDESTFYIGSALTEARLAARQELSKLGPTATLDTSYAPRFSRPGGLSSIIRKADGSYLARVGGDYVSGTVLTTGNWVHLKADGTFESAVSLPAETSILSTAPDGRFVATVGYGDRTRYVWFAADGSQQPLTLASGYHAFVFDSTGRLYERNDSNVIRRFLADGTVDASFTTSLTDYPFDIYPAQDGTTYVLLQVIQYGFSHYDVCRLLASGAIDPAFQPVSVGATSAGVVGLALPDGKLLLIEEKGRDTSLSYFRCRRFDTTGAVLYACNTTFRTATLAGVMWDSLRAAGASVSDRLSLSGRSFSSTYLQPDWLEVGGDGSYSVYTGTRFSAGFLSRYTRTDLSAPSVPLAPVIGLNPQSGSGYVGSSELSLDVVAFGLEPLTYEWKKDGQPVSSRPSSWPSNAPSLHLSDVVASDGGSYTVTVSNAYGSVTSAPATITMASGPPIITSQPASQAVTAGASASFAVQARGVPAPTFGWECLPSATSTWTALQDNATYSGTTTATLTISGATLALTGSQYRCVVRNSVGSTTSTAATLTVSAAPLTTPTLTWPAPAYIAVGTPLSDVQLNATANVAGSFAYSPAAGTVLSTGIHTLTVTFTPGDPAKFATATAQVSLTVVAGHYPGTYFGTFAAGGFWALQVKSDLSGYYLAYVADRHSAILIPITVDAYGSLSGLSTEITASFISGESSPRAIGAPAGSARATSFTLFGSIDGVQVNGELFGLHQSFTGALDAAGGAAASGFYSATALGTASGSVYAIVAPSGQALVVTTGATVDAATGTVNATGTFTATSVGGAAVAASLNGGSHSVSATITPSGGGAPVDFAGLAEGTPASTHLVNISARAFCSTGDRVTIGGFVISGSGTKRVLIRAVGPSLTAQGIGAAEVLTDPNIEVHHSGAIVATNENWGDNPNAAEITSVSSQIGATALLTGDAKSAALLLSLEPGVYSFIVHGKNDSSGIVLLEIYDADTANTAAVFSNISARAFCTTGNGVTIGGFVVAGNAPKHVLLRGVGPTLATQGIKPGDLLADPQIELHHGTGILATNDNVADAPNASAVVPAGARLGATPLDQADAKSSALLLTLPAGAYSFIVNGKDHPDGIVLVEVYDAD